jgi:hypothetical protein
MIQLQGTPVVLKQQEDAEGVFALVPRRDDLADPVRGRFDDAL